MKKAFYILLLAAQVACVTPKKTKKSAAKAKKPAMVAGDVVLQTNSASIPTPATTPAPSPAPKAAETCIAHETLGSGKPWVAGDTGFVVTGLTKPCKTAGEEKTGIDEASDFILMGIPCSHGEGRIDWKGSNYQKPKMVTFLLDTNCAFMPADLKGLTQEIKTRANASANRGRILAVNPLSVQYWKLDDYEDADPSAHIELRTNLALDKAWTQLMKNETVGVTLIGRENAWSGNDQFFEVKAGISHATKNRFLLKVKTIKALTAEEKAEYAKKCSELKPERDCSALR